MCKPMDLRHQPKVNQINQSLFKETREHCLWVVAAVFVFSKCLISISPLCLACDFVRDKSPNLSSKIKKTIDDYLKENNSLFALKYEIDNSKILIQDLKGSVVSLKVSTSRIEEEVNELSITINQISKGILIYIIWTETHTDLFFC